MQKFSLDIEQSALMRAQTHLPRPEKPILQCVHAPFGESKDPFLQCVIPSRRISEKCAISSDCVRIGGS
jgi:hypothetical protein